MTSPHGFRRAASGFGLLLRGCTLLFHGGALLFAGGGCGNLRVPTTALTRRIQFTLGLSADPSETLARRRAQHYQRDPQQIGQKQMDHLHSQRSEQRQIHHACGDLGAPQRITAMAVPAVYRGIRELA